MRPMQSFAVAIAMVTFASATPAAAQSIGVGGGLAGIENHDPVTAAVAVHVQSPQAGRLSFLASYAHWFGEDGNTGLGSGAFYGNDGLSLVGLYDVVARPMFQWGVGAGLAQYEVVVQSGDDEDSEFVGAVALSTLAKLRLEAGVELFVRGEVSAPSTEIQPRWSYLVAGVSIGL